MSRQLLNRGPLLRRLGVFRTSSSANTAVGSYLFFCPFHRWVVHALCVATVHSTVGLYMPCVLPPSIPLLGCTCLLCCHRPFHCWVVHALCVFTVHSTVGLYMPCVLPPSIPPLGCTCLVCCLPPSQPLEFFSPLPPDPFFGHTCLVRPHPLSQVNGSIVHFGLFHCLVVKKLPLQFGLGSQGTEVVVQPAL